MDAHRFDTLTRSLTGSYSRRILLRAIVGAPLGLVLAQRPDMARAKRRKKPKFNVAATAGNTSATVLLRLRRTGGAWKLVDIQALETT